jgi:tetratricopeptide (TPR) repeat protein
VRLFDAPSWRAPGLLAALVCAATVTSAPAALRPQALSQAPALARIYNDILDARFDAAERQVREGCGGAPPVACEILATVAMWWRIQMDPAGTGLDNELRAGTDRAIAAAQEWTKREPRRGEAWFYLGAAYAVRVQLRALRGERLAAARDGKRIKDALERALELDPSIEDAHFGIGLYHYYADIAPAALKLLRWLLLLPGGDREEGLAEMLQTRDRGELLRGEADYQLHLVYLWYEKQPDRALALLDELCTRYPHNPFFPARVAEVREVYYHDSAASLSDYESLLSEALAGRFQMPAFAETWARLGIATELDRLLETDRAIMPLEEIVEARPAEPRDATARAALALGRAYDRMGDRADAIPAYRMAVAAAPPEDPGGIRSAANDSLRHAPDTRKAEAYRLSIEGLRLLERGELGPARKSLERSLALNPDDPVAHLRLGQALAVSGEDDTRALAELNVAIRARSQVPDALLARAYYQAGRVLENQGERERAASMYENAVHVRGAEPDTKRAAARSLARLRGTR